MARDDEPLLVMSTLGGGLTALDMATNEIKWSIEDGESSYNFSCFVSYHLYCTLLTLDVRMCLSSPFRGAGEAECRRNAFAAVLARPQGRQPVPAGQQGRHKEDALHDTRAGGQCAVPQQ